MDDDDTRRVPGKSASCYVISDSNWMVYFCFSNKMKVILPTSYIHRCTSMLVGLEKWEARGGGGWQSNYTTFWPKTSNSQNRTTAQPPSSYCSGGVGLVPRDNYKGGMVQKSRDIKHYSRSTKKPCSAFLDGRQSTEYAYVCVCARGGSQFPLK